MQSNPELAVVVVNYNTRNLLRACLASVVERAASIPLELVVVDNASVDGSVDAVRKDFPQVVVIANQENRGFGAACNQAIRRTASPLVLLLNSDARLTPQALSALRDCMIQHPRCGAAGCRMTDSGGKEYVNARNFLSAFNQTLELLGPLHRVLPAFICRTRTPKPPPHLCDCSVDWIDGACLMLRRSALDEIGLFDERFFMYSEDEDLCFRLRKNNWSVCYTAAGTAIHEGAASARQNREEMLKHFYASQMLFLSKHRGWVSYFLYGALAKAILVGKRIWFQLLFQKDRCEELSGRISAMKQARFFIKTKS